jgi:hypothetical protein
MELPTDKLYKAKSNAEFLAAMQKMGSGRSRRIAGAPRRWAASCLGQCTPLDCAWRVGMSETWLGRSRVAWTVVACWLVAVPSHSAQAGRTRVEYDVEFSTLGSLLDSCAATGTDVLTGTLVGYEPAGRNEPSEYVGTLTRFTDIATCGSRTIADGTDVVCSINIKGQGLADVELRIEAGQREGYFQYVDRADWRGTWPPRPSATARSTVTGTCDPAELGLLQAEYPDGQTGGSPNGQPVEVASLPPRSYPFTFAPNPPRSIWTLKVMRRRP